MVLCAPPLRDTLRNNAFTAVIIVTSLKAGNAIFFPPNLNIINGDGMTRVRVKENDQGEELMCVCVRVRERERGGRERNRETRERERERERERIEHFLFCFAHSNCGHSVAAAGRM